MSGIGSRRRRLLWAVIAASALLRLGFAWGFLGFVTGDDVEVLEAAFHGAFGLDHEPWEIRNLLMPEVVVRPALEVARLVGVESAAGLVRAGLLPFVLLGSLATWLVFRLGARLAGDDRVGVLAATIHAFHPLVLAFSSSALPRVPAATAVVAAAVLLTGRRRGGLRGIAAGALAAIAFACRYSEVALLVPLAFLAWLWDDRASGRWLRLAGLAAGFTVEFARYTLAERQASAEVVAHPAWWYLWRLPRWLPVSLLPLLWFVPRRRGALAMAAFVLWPLLVLSAIHHKDLRYLQALVPFAAVLVAMAGVAWRDKGWRRTVAAMLALAIVYGLWAGYRRVNRRSMAAVAAAQAIADEPEVRTVVLSQAWAWGYRLFLGNGVAIEDLPVRASAADLERSLTGQDRVGIHVEDLEANPDLERVLWGRGLRRRETVARGGSKTVAVYEPKR